MIGKTLGHYEIQELIGAGGMGEVYRARDRRLDRIVAVKVLPPHLSDQPELRERFEREARTISSLSHPHICTLFDVGHHEGTDFLVMEFLEGESLATKLKAGALPVDQAIAYGVEVADALDKAHRLGVVHRDLKPGNIMITAAGAKLLDFGLAKVSAAAVQTDAPTNLTVRGTILGTVQYMSPEQLEGEEADARSDIFAFGALLYEMIAGRKAFEGKTQVMLISSIVSSEPAAPSSIRREVPAAIDHIIQRCLAKGPDERWQSISDVMRELKWASQTGQSAPAAAVESRQKSANFVWMGIAAALAVLTIVLGFLYWRTPAPVSIPMRLSLVAPAETTLAEGSGGAPWPELSPDGRRIVFGALTKEGKQMLFLRSLDNETPQVLNGTESGQQPFWSPDGRFIGFFAQNKLKRIDPAGGSPQTICDVPGNWREAAWGQDDFILFGTSNYPLSRVSAAGGKPEPFTMLDKSRGETSHLYPQFLPDGRHFIFLAQATPDTSLSSISVGSLDSKEVTHLINFNSKARYAAPGLLLFVRDAALVAQPFDSKSLKLSGTPALVVDSIRHTSTSGIAAFSVADSGMLAYRTGEQTENSQFVWYDRAGREVGKIGNPGFYLNPDLSPDGKQVVFEMVVEGNRDIWLLELARGVFTRFTSAAGAEFKALWSPDSQRLLYGDDKNLALVEKPVSAGGKERIVLKREATFVLDDWSPDGKLAIFDRDAIQDLWILPLSGDPTPYPLMQTRFAETEARFSPDGRWIVYVSNESGLNEIYAQSFPSNANRIRISTNGGTKPRWSRDGKEIFYIAADEKMNAVSVLGGKELQVGSPQALFVTDSAVGSTIRRDARTPYDVSSDGKRFLFLTTVQSRAASPVTLYTNWQPTLK